MNNHQNTLSRISEILTKGNAGAIIIPPNPSSDAIAASTSLYLGLTKIGKTISISCSSKVSSDLTAADKIQSNISAGGDSLMISFPYSDGSIDKVDYNIQGEYFNLIITPRPGYQKLSPNQVNYSYTGGSVDFIIVIDSPTLQNLGDIFTDNQKQFTGKDIINIDRHLTNAFFGTVNYVNKTISSVSEMILTVLQSLKIDIDRDMATNLYAGIATATNNFTSYSVNADTFQNISTLLRLGAIKKIVKKPNKPVSISPSGPEFQPVKPINRVEKEVKPDVKSPHDWLKPKIFKDSGLV